MRFVPLSFEGSAGSSGSASGSGSGGFEQFVSEGSDLMICLTHSNVLETSVIIFIDSEIGTASGNNNSNI